MFNTEFNLSFKKPNTETCDKLEIKMTLEGEEKGKVQVEKELQLRKKEAARSAKYECRESKHASHVLNVFDLKKDCLYPMSQLLRHITSDSYGPTT